MQLLLFEEKLKRSGLLCVTAAVLKAFQAAEVETLKAEFILRL